MPSVWLAEGHSGVAPVYLYRFDFATPMLRLLRIAAAHATELPFVWGNLVSSAKDPTFKLGGLKTGRAVSDRVRTRWVNFAAQGKPVGLPGEPDWPSYLEPDWTSLVIGREDAVVTDVDTDIRATWGTQVLNFR
jgi:para-nitrobenzyl esterase